jgi:hypothetical protein
VQLAAPAIDEYFPTSHATHSNACVTRCSCSWHGVLLHTNSSFRPQPLPAVQPAKSSTCVHRRAPTAEHIAVACVYVAAREQLSPHTVLFWPPGKPSDFAHTLLHVRSLANGDTSVVCVHVVPWNTRATGELVSEQQRTPCRAEVLLLQEYIPPCLAL